MRDEQRRRRLYQAAAELLRMMNQCLRTVSSSYLRDSRVKPQFLLLIHHIGSCNGISQKELNESIPLDKSYISTMVKGLIELGFVRNNGQGRDIFVMSRMMFDLLDRDLFNILTDEEKEILGKIMRKLDVRLNELIAEFSADE